MQMRYYVQIICILQYFFTLNIDIYRREHRHSVSDHAIRHDSQASAYTIAPFPPASHVCYVKLADHPREKRKLPDFS